MPLSSVQAAIAALILGIGNSAVALGVIGVESATTIESAIVGAIAAVFVLANAVIHHGATRAAGTDVSK